MKPRHRISDSLADEQAALWAARIDGDTLDRAQRAELDAWLAQDPSHRPLLSRYCQLSADLEEQIPALVDAGAVPLPPSVGSAPARRRRSRPRVLALVAAAAAAIALGFFVLRPSEPVQNVATAPGERQTHTLADGTRLELNAHTSLRFENGKTERRVRFAGGEALFMVAKDPSRPFIVETPGGSVRVTGTTFNVRSEPAATAFEVTVVEGSVQVRASSADGTGPSAPVALAAGDRFAARGGVGRKSALSSAEVDDALAWRQGQVVFNNTPLREAAARFAHYQGRAIHVAPSVAEEPIGARYSIDDLSGFLAGLEAFLDVTTSYDATGAVMIAPRPRK